MKSRYLATRLQEFSDRRLIILTGARQVGKTTLAKACFPNLRYINLDAMEYRELVRNVSSFDWGKDLGPAVLDEAQKEPDVFDKVKFAFDEGQVNSTVLLGSSQIMLMKKVRESLAGRAFILELWPLMFAEILADAPTPVKKPLLYSVLNDGVEKALQKTSAVIAGPQVSQARKTEEYLLQWGGMPELLRLNDTQRREWLRSYEITYLERDLADLARLDDLEPFRKFQQIAALRSAGLLNYSDLARDAGVSVHTSRRYLEYLRLSYQAILLQPWHTNLTSSVIKSPKLYWMDMGLLRQTGRIGEAVTGELYENYVVSEMWKWCKSDVHSTKLYFYRTRSGLEVDLLAECDQKIVGFEIKNRATVTNSDAAGLRKLASKLGDKWAGGMVVYTGDKIQTLEDNIWAVPSWRLFSGL